MTRVFIQGQKGSRLGNTAQDYALIRCFVLAIETKDTFDNMEKRVDSIIVCSLIIKKQLAKRKAGG